MIQDFPASKVEIWQATLNRYYRKWMGIASSGDASKLYPSTNHFGLNFKNLSVVHKKLQVIKWHIMKNSDDENARMLYRYRLNQDTKGHRGRRKFSACISIEKSLEMLSLSTNIVLEAQSQGTLVLVTKGQRW